MFEGAVINAELQITNQRLKQIYVIADYKNPDGIFNRARLHIKSVVAGPVLVPVPVNLPDATFIFTATTTTIVPVNTSTSVPSGHSTPVEPAPVPTTTTTITVPANCPTIFAPASEPKSTTTFTSNTPTPVFPEPDTTTTTHAYANPPPQNSPVTDPTPPTQNSPVPDPIPPPQNSPAPDPTPPPQNSPLPDPDTPSDPVAPVPDTTLPTTSTPTVVADNHGVKWYNSEDVTDLNEVPSLQWDFTNQFGDAVYPNSGVWVSRLDAWLMMHGKKNIISLTTPTWSCSGKIGTHLSKWPRRCSSKVWRGWRPVLNLVNWMNYGLLWAGNTCQLLSPGRLTLAVTDPRISSQHRDTQNIRHPDLQI